MKIGIIVHSKTGHTLTVAQKLNERLQKAGHTVSIEQVIASNDGEVNVSSISLTNTPKLDGYDILVFGAPVRGYRLSPVFEAFLLEQSTLGGKIVYGFVTQFFPKPSMGGNGAIARLTEVCSSKGAHVKITGVINWTFSSKRNKLISETINNISNSL